MSSLGAFFRGAAGPGMLALADSYDRRDAEERAAAARRLEREREMAFRAEQSAQDRMARYGSDGTEPGMLSRGQGRAGGGAAPQGEAPQPGPAMADVGRMMEEGRMSEGDARSYMAASAAGKNIYQRENKVPQQFDDGDGRMKTASTTEVTPDEERWMRMNMLYGKILSESGPRAKSNYDQLTAGDGNAQRNQMTGGMRSGKLTPAQTAEGVAASKGEGGFGKGGVNQFSGKADAVGRSTIRENDAQAGSAGRANRDGGKTGDKAGDTTEYEDVTRKTTTTGKDGTEVEETVKSKRAKAAAVAAEAASVPAEAANFLRKNPNLAAEFDNKYGKGAAAKVMESAPSQAKPAAKPAPKSTEATEKADPIRQMDTRTLREIAAIPGHQNQVAAKAELKRREAERDQAESADTSTPGA